MRRDAIQRTAARAGVVARAVSAFSEKDYPRLHAARAELLSGTGEERFTWALDVLLQGILHARRSPQARSSNESAKTRARGK